VWVFVRIESPMGERPCEFTYAVAGPAQRREIAARMGRSVGVSKLVAALGTVSAAELLGAIHSSLEGHR